ncbi:DNA repair protein XRCC4 [Hyperolius riggenbachi]|uniref:DNA repair protein XRCC4 n=1 Tax=Hyperolius riggenbachi TaxID=752182 RepID=UPI0035A3379F
MEKKVQKIAIASNPGGTYFLQIGWKKDLDKGFSVTLCNGNTAWIGKASAEDVSREAADMEMEKPKYVDELKKALIAVTQPPGKYSFDLLKDGEDPNTYCFTYEKKLKDVSFKLGSIQLKNAADPAEIIKELINHCLDRATELHSRNEHLQTENERLRCDWDDMNKQLEKFVSGKEQLEQDLYTRFTLVLNEKKAKIRSLKEKLSQSEQKAQETQKVQEVSHSSVPFDTVPVSELKTDDYSGSTDDESKSSQVTKETAPPPVSRRRSLVQTPDDSPDIAPSRKRRQRGQKIPYTGLKENTSQPEHQERSNAAPSKTTGKNPSSENPPLPTSKSTPDPDDLFGDI